MTTLELLIKGRQKIADPVNWCQGQLMRSEAVCSVGALTSYGVSQANILKAYNALAFAINPNASREATEIAVFIEIAVFNDTHTHAEVIAVWDKAIETERQKQTQEAVEIIKSDALKGAEHALEQGSNPGQPAQLETV